ncbi:MAG: hypothetical protein CL862_00745 [Cyanobium sp. NAT70]|nr:hypothetical protein [Cyanobium sp. NAT70]|tara:strand:- start:1149 stop:1379 length:231 start_codon:yes stop_codon:yes gene_type:complete
MDASQGGAFSPSPPRHKTQLLKNEAQAFLKHYACSLEDIFVAHEKIDDAQQQIIKEMSYTINKLREASEKRKSKKP